MTHTQHAYPHMEKDWCLESLLQLNFQGFLHIQNFILQLHGLYATFI